MRLAIKYLIRFYYAIMFRVEVVGLENYPLNTGKVICPNHINVHDPVVLGAFLPDFVHFMTKKEAFKYKIFNWFLYYAGGFPVDREGTDVSAIKTSLRILKDKKGLMIFAEGTRNKTTTPLEVKAGVAMLAVKSKVPVVPITVDSTFRLFSPIRIVIHPAVHLDHLYDTKPSQEVLQAETQKIVNLLYENLIYYKGRI